VPTQGIALPRVVVRGPKGQVEHALDLDRPSALLLGREPDPRAAAQWGLGAAEQSLEALTVPGPSVSANHVVVWSQDGTVCVRDLRSRNGTWLLLPRGETVRVGPLDIVLQVAQASGGASVGDEPAPPSWSNRRDFAPAMADSIQKWLRTRGVEVRATVIPQQDDDGASEPSRLPMATGESLDFVPLGTTDANWSRLLEQLWRWVEVQNSIYRTEEETRREGMILSSWAIRGAHREVVEAAKAGASTLLLTGPSGAGKDMLAGVFHRHSGRAGPFVAVNCSMFSKDMFRSELFGAEAGSFTGATRRIVGAAERAEGGTLFLDEIGDIPIDIQPMLLRFLDRREYERLGHYGRVQHADVRVVAATNRDLRDAARTGSFRVDLWYRLAVREVEVPALRTRWDDVVAYLESVRTEDGRHSIREALSQDAFGLLQAHPWAGNFRELTSFVQRLPRTAKPESIDAATCRRELQRVSIHPTSSIPSPPAAAPTDWTALVSRAVRAYFEDQGREPASWNDQKELIEKYLKPLVFVHLSGASAHAAPADGDAMSSLAAKMAARVQADRGTANKQLTRYFERFRT
jgi:DNA-binding NtrC family response regulator